MSPPSAPIRILLVDDDRDLAELAATFLERKDDGFSVEIEVNASAGLDALAEREFDCVVSDYDMPGRNGIEFLEAVREEDGELPFILFTGKGSEEIASDAISAGVTDYLQKESGTEQYAVLANRIRNVVERAEARAKQQRQLDAIETAREGISILDEDREFISVNRAYADLYGYEPEEMIGERWENLYREEDVAEIREEVLPTVESEGYWRGETVGVRANGETFTEDHVLALADTGELVCTVRDATTRIEREEELEQAQARLEALFENSPDMISTHDADGIIRDVNRRFCDELGYEPEEIVGRGIWDLDPTLDRADLRPRLADTETGERFRIETEFRRTDGSTIPVEAHVVRLSVAGDDPFMVITRDVSERNARENELERLKERYQAFIERSSDLVSVVDEAGEIQYLSPAVERMFGYTPAELIGANAFEYFHPDDRERVRDEFAEMIESTDAVTEHVEYRFRHADGSWRWVETVGSNETESVIDGFVLTTRDISRGKEHERRLEALYDTAHELITAESREEVTETGVEAARDIIGLEANAIHLSDAQRDGLRPVSATEEVSELIGSPPVFTDGDSIAWRAYEQDEVLALDDIRDDPDVFNPETPIRSELHLPLAGHGILIAGAPSVAAFDREDLVLGKLLAKSIAVALDQLEHESELARQNQRLEQFASFISHDLRNPLTVAEGNLELAREDCESAHLDTVERAHGRMRTLIDDLLTVAREQPNIDEREPIALGDVCRDCWENSTTKNATLEVDVERTVKGDRSRVQQLLENLFRNAVEHGGEDVTVTVGELPDGFFVEDDGAGIRTETPADLFDVGHSTSQDGTGFGLAIAEQVVETHGWDVHATTGSDGGARFEITGVDVES